MKNNIRITAKAFECYDQYFGDMIPHKSIAEEVFELYHLSIHKDYNKSVDYEVQNVDILSFKQYFTEFKNLNFDKILCDEKLSLILFIIDRLLIDVIGDKSLAFQKITAENKNSYKEINVIEFDARPLTTDYIQYEKINLRNSKWFKSILEKQPELKNLLNLIDKKNKSDVNLSFKLMIDGDNHTFSNTCHPNDYYLPNLVQKLFSLLIDEIETIHYEDLLNSKNILLNPIKDQYNDLEKQISNRISKIVADMTKNSQYSKSKIQYINWVILAHLCFKKTINQWYKSINHECSGTSLFKRDTVKLYYKYISNY